MNSETESTSATPQANTAQPASDKTFTPLVKQFLEYLKLEKHFSDYTVKSYGADLIQFGQFLGGEIGELKNTHVGHKLSHEPPRASRSFGLFASLVA